MKREVLIVHYNTPELTDAAILSLRKHGGEDYHFTIFDNSDARPFAKQMNGVDVIDNTLGKEIDLDAEIRKFPNRSRKMGNAHVGDFPSARHMLSVQWFMDNFDGDGFLLMDSDVLIRENIDFMFMPDQCTCGHIQTWQRAGNPGKKDRLVPLVCYIGVKKCKECGVSYFNPDMTFALHDGGEANTENWYDTGSSFLYEIRSHKNGACGKRIDIRPLMVHYGSASWKNTDTDAQQKWLEQYKDLWKTSPDYQLGQTAWKRPENKGAKIYICTHKDFRLPVDNPVYEVLDARKDGDSCNGIPGSFFSEFLVFSRICQQKRLPGIVGFCQYRKYFHWMSDVPDLKAWLKRYGCLVSQAIDLGKSVRDHYSGVGNVEDLDIATDIIKRNHPEFFEKWQGFIKGKLLHPASTFIMPTKDFRRMMPLVEDVIHHYLLTIGSDINKRIKENPEMYHIPGSTIEYQRRVGGQLCERIVSAWIDWQFPNAKEVPIRFIR